MLTIRSDLVLATNRLEASVGFMTDPKRLNIGITRQADAHIVIVDAYAIDTAPEIYTKIVASNVNEQDEAQNDTSASLGRLRQLVRVSRSEGSMLNVNPTTIQPIYIAVKEAIDFIELQDSNVCYIQGKRTCLLQRLVK